MGWGGGGGGGVKLNKNWVGGEPILKNHLGRGERKKKFVVMLGFFYFNFLTISCHGN